MTSETVRVDTRLGFGRDKHIQFAERLPDRLYQPPLDNRALPVFQLVCLEEILGVGHLNRA